METIRVNMTPCEDIKTIHASQNDNEAREWGFELHNNGEKIDSSSISDQLVFKAYKGGTEQILPENGSTPTTSPFKGGIKYPQGLLTDQYFTYRESPTPVDGLAKIKSIKGNTLVWNQQSKLAQNWSMNFGRATVTRGDDEITVSNVSADYYAYQGTTMKPQNGHVILVTCYAKANNGECGLYTNFGGAVYPKTSSSTYQLLSVISKETRSNATNYDYNIQFRVSMNSDSVSFKNPQIFDLTQMFGSGNEPSTVEEFTSLFPLSYYAYNQGTLLSFMGNGIKTVGKNLFDETKYQNIRSTYDYYDSGYYCRSIQLLPNTEYTISQRATTTSSVVLLLNKYSHVNESGFFDCRNAGGTKTYVTDSSGCLYIGIYANNSNAEANQRLSECQIQIEHGSTATAYEPYTESVINLPISTYFPTGMKSAGSVYDELTPTKGITRIGAVTFNGSENWSYDRNNALFKCAVSGAVITNATTQYNVYTKNNRFDDKSWATRSDGSLGMYYGASYIFIKSTQFADVSALKTWLQSNPVTVYFELATPTETSFTTASLVTENAEIPLSNEDGVLIGKCTEQLSENPGFFDGKIKLADGDGECYSNKIQLHIERSPQ